MTASKKTEDGWEDDIFTPPPIEPGLPVPVTTTIAALGDDDDEEESESESGDDESEEEPEVVALKLKKSRPHTVRASRSMEECEGLVKNVDDATIALLLIAAAKEAIVRGIDPTISLSSAKGPAGGGPMANVHDLWGRVISRVDRSKRGGFRFDGSPIYGRGIIGRELSNIGVSEDGVAAPVVFGRKDMRGTLWLAVGEKGAGFDMAGTNIVGMRLLCMSNTSDGFEKLCDQAEAMLAGVGTEKVTDRRTTEEKLKSLDEWE
jgi:hypothetical protein